MKIAENVLGVLSRFEISQTPAGWVGTIQDGQLDRKLYLKTNQILEELGGQWNRKLRGHLFPEDPTGQLDQVLLLGEITRAKQELGFFETPEELARRVTYLAGAGPGVSILEPSAGSGRIARAAVLKGSVVSCVELDPKRAAGLAQMGYEVQQGDFLAVTPPRNPYGGVAMNPPFSRQQDIRHVTHAMRFLRPGGKLASIMSTGVEFREDRRTREFRELVRLHGGRIERLPSGTFRESGTDVETVLVVMTR